MKKLLLPFLLPFLLSFIIAGELEVDGNLTVTGDIVSPTIDALRDDGNYEYVIILVTIDTNSDSTPKLIKAGFKRLDYDDFGASHSNAFIPMGSFNSEVTTLFNDGWTLHSINGDSTSWWIFKRAINE